MRNVARFEDCRAFETSSEIRFDGPEGVGPEDKATPRAVPLPAGASLTLRLRTPIEWGSSRVGDRLEAELLRPVRSGGSIVADRGQSIWLRIRRLQRRTRPEPFFVVGLSLVGNHGDLDSFTAPGADIAMLDSVSQRDSRSSHREIVAERETERELAGVSTFYVFGGTLELRRARMRWTVSDPPADGAAR